MKTSTMGRFRERLTYANVTASIALFVALGGTSYAVVQLPKDSVGRAQIRTHAVARPELATGAVTSRSIRDRSIGLGDISSSARRSLRGVQGPVGPQGPKGDVGAPAMSFHAGVNSAGALVRGNAVGGGHGSSVGVYQVEWSADVSACDAVATLASVPGGIVTDPPAGRITVKPSGRGIEVHTYDADGAPADSPFSIAVAC